LIIFALIPPAMITFAYWTIYIFNNDNIGYMTHTLIHPTVGVILPLIPIYLRLSNNNLMYIIST